MKSKFKNGEIKNIMNLFQELNKRNDIVYESDFDEPHLVTSLTINGKEIELSFNYVSDYEVEYIDLRGLHNEAKLKETDEVLCDIHIYIALSLFDSFWSHISMNCDDMSASFKNTFESIFFCDDEEFEKNIPYKNQNINEYIDYNNTPIWIHLEHLEVNEKYRGMGYGQAILKYLIDLFGVNNDDELYEFYSTKDVVFSVYPHPIGKDDEYDRNNPKEKKQYNLKLKSIQNFYKKIGFSDFFNRGYFVYKNIFGN
jgi:GNAT superfamily N-acetyltransferase